MAESPASLDRTSSLERTGSFSEAMLHFKRAAVLKRKPEPDYSFCLHKHYCKAANRSNKIHCDCGETENEPLAWQWDRAWPGWAVTHRPTHVVCHETLSTGTMVLLGDTPLRDGGHHFWEVKLLTELYGTDTMIGVCTNEFNPRGGEQQFASLLGSDRHSWGLSYHGNVHHAGVMRHYTSVFGKGSIVGVYANLRSGRLEFFLNRRSLGVAFTDLPRPSPDGPRLLPAFCTTAANTCIRLVTAVSVEDSLQFQATAVITRSLPRWSLALPAPICRLVRRFAWLEYRQPPRPAAAGSVKLLDDSPAQEQSAGRPTADSVAGVAHGPSSSSLPDSGPGPPGVSPEQEDPLRPADPPENPLWPEDTPPLLVVSGAARPAAAGPRLHRRIHLYVSPEDEMCEEACPTGQPAAGGASPPLRARPGAFVTLVSERRGGGRRRSEPGAGTGRGQRQSEGSGRRSAVRGRGRPRDDGSEGRVGGTVSDGGATVSDAAGAVEEAVPERHPSTEQGLTPVEIHVSPNRTAVADPGTDGDADAGAEADTSPILGGVRARERDTARVLLERLSTASTSGWSEYTGVFHDATPSASAPGSPAASELLNEAMVTSMQEEASPVVVGGAADRREGPGQLSGDAASAEGVEVVREATATGVLSRLAADDRGRSEARSDCLLTSEAAGGLSNRAVPGNSTCGDARLGEGGGRGSGDGDTQPVIPRRAVVGRRRRASTASCGQPSVATTERGSNVPRDGYDQPGQGATMKKFRRSSLSCVSDNEAVKNKTCASSSDTSNELFINRRARRSSAASAISVTSVMTRSDPEHSQLSGDTAPTQPAAASSAAEPKTTPPTAREPAVPGAEVRRTNTAHPGSAIPSAGGASTELNPATSGVPTESAAASVAVERSAAGEQGLVRRSRRLSSRRISGVLGPVRVSKAVSSVGDGGLRARFDPGGDGELVGASTVGGEGIFTRVGRPGLSSIESGESRGGAGQCSEASGEVISSVTASKTRRRSAVSGIATEGSSSSSDVKAAKTRRRSTASEVSEGSTDVTAARNRRRSAAFGVGERSGDVSTAKSRRRSAVGVASGDCSDFTLVKNRRRSVVGVAEGGDEVKEVKTRRRSVVGVCEGSSDAKDLKNRGRSEVSEGNSDVTAVRTRRLSVVSETSDSSSEVAVNFATAVKTTRRPGVPIDNSDIADAVKTRRRSGVGTAGSCGAPADVKARCSSDVGTDGSCDVAAALKARRRSGVSSDVAATATSRRRSGVGTESDRDATVTAKTRRRSGVGAEASSDATATAKARRRSGLASDIGSEATATGNTRRRSGFASDSGNEDTAAAKTRRGSGVGKDSSSDVTASARTRRRSGVGIEASSDVTAPAKSRRRSGIGSDGSSDATATGRTRRLSVVDSDSDSSPIVSSGRSAVAREGKRRPRADSGAVSDPGWDGAATTVTTGVDSGNGVEAAARCRLWVGEGPESPPNPAPRPSAASRRRRRSLDPAQLASDLASHGLGSEAMATRARLERARQRRRRPPANLSTVLEESSGHDSWGSPPFSPLVSPDSWSVP